MAGYSGTPLVKKLGIKEGFKLLAVNAPDDYLKLLGALPDRTEFISGSKNDVSMIHPFIRSRKEMEKWLPKILKQIKQDGMIWVSWPKKSSGTVTDVTEDIIRETALPLGLVDIKVCAVDETWSGLKLVIRKENRK